MCPFKINFTGSLAFGAKKPKLCSAVLKPPVCILAVAILFFWCQKWKRGWSRAGDTRSVKLAADARLVSKEHS